MADDTNKTRLWIGSIAIAIVFASVVAVIGGCGTTIYYLSEQNVWDDPGAGFAFWIFLFPQITVLIPASIVFGGIIGYFVFRFSNNQWKRIFILSSVGGILGGITLVIVLNLIIEQIMFSFYGRFLQGGNW